MVLKVIVYLLPFLLVYFDNTNRNLAQASQVAPSQSKSQFYLGDTSLIADITYLKKPQFNDRKDVLQELTRVFPTLYLSAEISEMERVCGVIFGNWSETIQSDLALNLVLGSAHEPTVVYNTIDSALKRYRLEEHIKIILLEFDGLASGSGQELFNISMLFNKMYSNSAIVLGESSFNELAFHGVISQGILSVSSIISGFFIRVIDQEYSDALHDFFVELTRAKLPMKTIYMTVPSLLLHLKCRRKATDETESFPEKENGLQTMAKEFKDLLNQLNASLVVLFDCGNVDGSILEFGPAILYNKAYFDVPDLREVLKISDTMLWTSMFVPSASVPNFITYDKYSGELMRITNILYNIGDLYPKTQQILGITLGFAHWIDYETCEPNTGANSKEFLEIIYTWAQIYGIRITEMNPFTTFTEYYVAYGRWSVIPFSGFTLNKSVIDMNDRACIKWNPFKIEGSNYTKMTGASVSLNVSLLYDMNSNAQLDLMKIAARRFELLELYFLNDFAAGNDTCLTDIKLYSIINQFELMQESNNSTKLYISMEQDKNIFESLNCFVDHMSVTNISILSGVHISLNSLPKVYKDNLYHHERMLAALTKLQKRRIKIGVLFKECAFTKKLLLHQLYMPILNNAEYVVCDSLLESEESYPLNFDKLHFKIDVARALNLQLQSQESVWRRKPKVMLRIGWPKPEILSLDEVNENFLKFFRDVNEITKAYGIPLFINGAFHSEDSNYVGWWYGNLTNVSSIIERESEFMGFDTWRPKVPESDQFADSKQTKLIMWISVPIVVIFFFSISCVSVLIVRKKRQNNILSDSDIQEFFEEELNDLNESNIDGSVSKMKDRLKHDVPWKTLKLDKSNKIGSGQFGVVYATTLNDQKVAVKVSKERSKECVKSIMSEIKIMVFLGEHKHILNFYGAYTRELKRGIICLVTEFCETGSLHSYLQSVYSNACLDNVLLNNENVPPVSFVSIHELCRFCYEIALGMDFLGVKNVVHGDLSARNVLLDWQLCCKISDFGFSRKVQEYADDQQSYNEIVPWRWMAIEALSRLEFTTKSDVWSFGVTTWEIFTLGSLPYAGINWNETFVADLTEGLRLTKPSFASDEIFKTLTDCWSNDPSDRPNFTILCEIFKRHCPSDYAKV
ncbi:unnamed protein product [Orchesella dallaii]|uniref:Protein kinase domain-containing protein n=1 Tax=Orchesella dallaii TaxID=48710 RepID=A0ABP1RQ01_9HEXA